MNKLFAIGIGIIILVAILAAVLFIRLPAIPRETAEEQALSALEQELEQAISSITAEDIENALLK